MGQATVQEPALPAVGTPRQEAFGYVCQRCSRCCHDKTIQINPYEVARLARRLGQSTTAFREASTVDAAGTRLKQTAAGSCVFLGEEGCTVHSDRPAVCRIYPLQLFTDSDGGEWFEHAEPHPQSEGKITKDGTIAAFLENQGAIPFIAASELYFRWYCAAKHSVETEPETASDDHSALLAATALLDMDLAVAQHCRALGIAEPKDLDDRMQCHLEILYQQIDPSRRSAIR